MRFFPQCDHRASPHGIARHLLHLLRWLGVALAAMVGLAVASPSLLAQGPGHAPSGGRTTTLTVKADRQQAQTNALADAVEAYRALASDGTGAVDCNLRQLCSDEQYTVQISGAYAQLYYSLAVAPPIKLASFPRTAIRIANRRHDDLTPFSPEEISYIKLRKSLSTFDRTALANRQRLYSFPNVGDNSFLPWPPRRPSASADVTAQFRTHETLGSLADQIQSKIGPRGYDGLRYFSVPGGFAVATCVERVGRREPVAPRDRWTVGKRGGFGSLFDYWRRLLSGEDDRFRVFVLLITDEDVQNNPHGASAEDLQTWKAAGRPALSRMRAAADALPGTRVWLYVYEFEASRSKDAELIENEHDPLRIKSNMEALGL